MALRPGAGGGGSFMFPVAGSHGPSQGMMPMQQQQQQQQPGYPMVQVMQPNMQGMMGLNFGAQMPSGTMPMQGGMPMGPMQAAGMQYMGQPQFMGMTAPGPQYMPDMQKQLAEEHQKRLEHQQRMLEEDRKRRQFEEQKQKLRLLSSVKPKMGEKSRDDALEAIKGNLDGFSRDAKMHPTPASHPKKPDMPPSHSTASSSSSSSLLSQPPAFPEDDDDDFSDFMQGPVEPMSSVTSTTSSSSFQPSSPRVQGPHSSEQAAVPSHPAPPPQAPLPPVPLGSAGHHPSVSTSTTSSQASALKGPSLEEKLVSSCDLSASKQAQVHFKSSQPLAEMGHKAPVSAHFQPSTKARNWGIADSNLRAVFTVEAPPPSPLPASTPAKAPPPANETDLTVEESGVGVYPQQEAIQPMVPGWLYNDSLVPDLFKKVLEITMTPSGIDTAKLYPILMSSGLPREALGQIWASANRTTPGKLTKEELYTVLAMIGVTQRGLPAMSLDILTQFPSAPVPNLPGLALVMPGVMQQQQQHQQQPMLSMPPVPQPAVSMPLSTAQPVLGVNLPVQAGVLSTQVSPGFMPSFPSNTQASEPDDDDFQDFQEAPKAGSADDSFTDFQGESSGAFPIAARTQPQNSALALLTPISGSSTSASSDKYAVFKQLSVERPGETTVPVPDYGDKYSVFRALEQPPDIKPIGEGFADFRSAGGDDGFTDFKTADSISPLDPPEQAKIFQQTFPPPFLQTQPLQQQPQPHNSTATLPPLKPPLNMADLDLFSSLGGPAASTTAETKPLSFPAPSTLASSLPPLAAPSSGAGRKALSGADDFGDFALFGSSSLGVSVPSAGAGHVQDDFADFMAFGSASSSGVPEQKTVEEKPSENNSSVGETPLQQQQQKSSDKYDIFKRLSLEGSTTPLSFEDAKESLSAGLASSSSVVKGDADDFADFQSSRFSSALGASEKSLVDKVAAFKQAKEDSASVKSLDLPSIGGSSAGKEDSEDALSVQLDMKLSDLGGELQHVLSDSSLDLPVVSGHQPPAAEVDDFKFDPFGTFSACDSAVSSLASFDWSEREEPATNQSKKPQPSFTSEGSPASATSVLQKKETSFGSAENVAVTTSGKVNAFTSEEASSTSTVEGQFDTFADFGTKGQGEEEEEEDDFGDFASTVSEKSDTAPVSGDPGSDTTQPDDFGASQADKPKFGKFDFLMASSQAKVKSSEEMIRSELATFDLSVQGSHKRSLSLGDKEISHSTPSPAPEQPFRDKSNTLSEKPALPVIRDKYKDLTGEVEESERYAYEWQRCLESALQVINKANDTLNGISSSSVCTEVIQSAQGMEYLLGVVEVYRVVRRVELGIKATAVCSDKLQQLLKDINRVWHNLIGFMSLANLSPDESSLDFSSCILRHGIKNAKELACGVCLLSVDSRSKTSGLPLFTLVLNVLQKKDKAKERPPKNAFSSETDSFKLMYGGHQYHASCANFWINCVEPKPPGLILPDLL